MSQLEDKHWWFVGRRNIVFNTIKILNKSFEGAKVLDAGCGTGGNLKMMRIFGDVLGLEVDSLAAQIASCKSSLPVVEGSIPDHIPFPPDTFDLIFLLDVLEHIEDDGAALKALYRLLKPGGNIIITVPAFSILWSNHDLIHHHKRTNKISLSGFKLNYISYYNFVLFPLILVIRLFKKMVRLDIKQKDLTVPPSFLNTILTNVFSYEKNFIGKTCIPFGVSIIACATKKG